MLKKEHIKRQIKKELKKLYAYLQNYYLTQEPEDLHGLRIQIKKIRSVLFFDQEVKPNKKLIASFSPLKTLFKEAGAIRLLQINCQLFQKFHIHAAHQLGIQQELIYKKNRLFLHHMPIHLKKIETIQKKLLKGIKDIDAKTLAGSFSRTITNINKSLRKKTYKSEPLHETRKHLKNIVYMHEALTKSLQNKLHLNIKYMNKLQELIGNWHDVEVSLAFLKNNTIAEASYTKGLKEQCKQLVAEIKQKSKDFTEKI